MVVRVVGAMFLVGLLASVLVGSATLGGCSGKYDDGTGGASSDDDEPTPPQQCQTYASTWCNKSFGCYVQVGRLAESDLQYNVDQCIQVISDALPCSGVTKVGEDYDKCISQIKAMPCSKWNVPTNQFGLVARPASCDFALEF
jgi:hypothetical protein